MNIEDCVLLVKLHNSVIHHTHTLNVRNLSGDGMTILAWSCSLVYFALSQVYARIGNSKTDVHYVRMVQVYERITHITCSTPHFNPSGCALTLNVRTGSHVDLLVQYPNYNITRRVIGNQTTVQPPACPQYGYVYKYTILPDPRRGKY